jgi:hypothetical protein
MRLRPVWVLLLSAALRLPAVAATDDLVVRTDFSPREAWVGQRVVLQVDVLAADAWAQLERMPRIELPGAYVLPPQGQGVRLQETIGGRSFSGQRYEFFVYPQRAGKLVLPDTAIEVRVRQLGAGGGEEMLPARLPELTFESRVPPGADQVQGLISTTGLRVEQRWEPADGVRQVGDAVRRTVRLVAPDVPGMAFPPFDHGPVEGFGVYPAEPQVDDRFERGSLQGVRTETVTYVAERAGRFELPAISFVWWDTAGEQLQQAELPGMTVTVSGGAATAAPALTAATPRPSFWWWVLGGTAALVLFLYRPLARRWRAAAQSRARSERHQFRLLRAAIRRGRPAPVLRELMRWLDRVNDTGRPARLDRFLERYGDPDTRQALGALQRDLEQSQRIADRRGLLNYLVQARRRWLAQHDRRKAGILTLPPLNGAPGQEA